MLNHQVLLIICWKIVQLSETTSHKNRRWYIHTIDKSQQSLSELMNEKKVTKSYCFLCLSLQALFSSLRICKQLKQITSFIVLFAAMQLWANTSKTAFLLWGAEVWYFMFGYRHDIVFYFVSIFSSIAFLSFHSSHYVPFKHSH